MAYQQQQRHSTSPEFGDFLSTITPTQPPLMQAPPTQLLQPQPSADSLLLLDDTAPAKPEKVWHNFCSVQY